MAQRKKNNNSKRKKSANVVTTTKALVTHDFFSEGISINENEVFPMVVIATMSSGKSTLINSLFKFFS